MGNGKIIGTIDGYINTSPSNARGILNKIRKTIRGAAPAATETISYGMPTFTLHGNLIHFAAFARHIGIYPTPSGITAFASELRGYKTSKGAITFPLDSPIPYDLIRRITLFRVKENLLKIKKK